MRWFRSSLRAGVLLFVLVTIDGCFHRDPWVAVGNGYGIGACAPSQPCALMYSLALDKRPRSDWMASRFGDEFVLHKASDQHDEWLVFDSEAAWRQAWHEKQAVRGIDAIPSVEGVTGFKQKGAWVLGTCDDGFFLANIDQDQVELWKDHTEWDKVVTARTGFSTANLSSPKSFWLQTREPAFLAILAVVTLVVLPWVLWPLRSRRMPMPLASVDEEPT